MTKEYKGLLPEIRLQWISGTMHKFKVTRSTDAIEPLKVIIGDSILIRESFVAILFNRQNISIGWYMVSQGGMTGTVVDPKLIFSHALKALACTILICHNHPSGNRQPSQADIDLTTKIKEGCKLLDITLLDHIILTEDEGYFSFADEGLL